MRRFVLQSLALFVVLALCGGVAVAERLAKLEWPAWRGPNRDGKSTETGWLKEWPDDGPPLAWKTDGLGIGFSSISIQADRIYTMGEEGGVEYVIALLIDGGKRLWATRVGDGAENGGYRGPRCTPTADGNRLYALGSRGDLVCLNAATGKELWRKNLKSDFDGKMMSGWGYSESPLVDGDKLICTPGGQQATLIALDKNSGDVIWRGAVPEIGSAGRDGAGYSSPVVSEAAGVRQYVQLLGRGVVGVDAETGKFLWGYNRIAGRVANIPTPIVQGDYVFCTTGYNDGGSVLLKIIHKGAELNAEEVWYKGANEFRNHHGGLVLVDDHLYGGHGQNQGFPTAIELTSGEMPWGRQRPPAGGSAAVTYADGMLYFRYQDGTMALVAADPSEYRLISTFKIPDVSKPSWPHPVILNGKLYLREQEMLYCYDLSER